MANGMTIVGIIGQKGGGGKTTTSLGLAVAAAEDGKTVAVIDLDQQANSAKWRDRRQANNVAVIGSWMNPDFGVSLRMLQLRRRKDANGKKIYLDDLMAEALNDLFLKYDVPTVHHE